MTVKNLKKNFVNFNFVVKILFFCENNNILKLIIISNQIYIFYIFTKTLFQMTLKINIFTTKKSQKLYFHKFVKLSQNKKYQWKYNFLWKYKISVKIIILWILIFCEFMILWIFIFSQKWSDKFTKSKIHKILKIF